jgi:hypothetical protein
MPVTVFQGKQIINGNNPDNDEVYTQLIQNLAAETAKVELTNLQHSTSVNTLSGTVGIELKDQSVITDNLKLKYVIIEKVSNQYTNSAQVPCKNVVIASGNVSLADADLQQPISFNLNFTGTLPSDAYLVIWAQELPTDFNNNAFIYQALESYIPPSTKK